MATVILVWLTFRLKIYRWAALLVIVSYPLWFTWVCRVCCERIGRLVSLYIVRIVVPILVIRNRRIIVITCCLLCIRLLVRLPLLIIILNKTLDICKFSVILCHFRQILVFVFNSCCKVFFLGKAEAGWFLSFILTVGLSIIWSVSLILVKPLLRFFNITFLCMRWQASGRLVNLFFWLELCTSL